MRKLFIVMGVFFGAVLLAFLGMGVFLMLSPGSKLFGVQYVKADNTSSADVTKTYNEILTGNIIIEAYGAPITVEYSTFGTFEFTFVQKYNGFTKTNIEKPTLSLSKDEDGNLIVKATEFVPFIWGSSGSGYALKCKIPASYTGKALSVKSTKSTINLKTSEGAAGVLSTATLSTKGQINLSGEFTIGDLSIKNTQSAITIPSTFSLNNITTSMGKHPTTIKSAVSGKITHNSKKGALTFVSCGELAATTTGGSVESTSTGTSVSGKATVKTSSGRIILQQVGGDLSVSTTKGKVFIGQNQKGTVAGANGKVTISSKSGNIYLYGTYAATDFKVTITTTTGSVTIGDNSRSDTEKANGPLATISKTKITTTSGKVTIEKITDAEITTKSGNVTIGNFSKASITTSSGDVNVSAGYILSDLTISAGKNGNVKATNLTGTTKINTQGAIYAAFKSVSGRVEISGKNKAVKVILPNEITVSNRHFWVKSSKTSATIHIADVVRATKSYKTIDEIDSGDNTLIKVTSESGKITLISKKYE